MGYPSEQQASHGDMDHGVGDVDALLVVAHEATPPCHPAEDTFDHPTPRQDLEAWLVVDPADDFDDEIEESG